MLAFYYKSTTAVVDVYICDHNDEIIRVYNGINVSPCMSLIYKELVY